MGLDRRRLLYYAVEETYNNSANPSPATGAILSLSAVQFEALIGETIADEEFTGTLGAQGQSQVEQRVKMSFETYCSAPGVAGDIPVWGTLIEACGYVRNEVAGVSQTYSPIEDSIKSLTFVFWRDGKLHLMTGARGKVSISGNIKTRLKMSWEFEGYYHTPTQESDVDLSDADFSGWTRSIISNSGNTTVQFGTHTVGMYEFTYTGGQSFVDDEDSNAKALELSARESQYQLIIKEPDLDVANFYDLAAKSERLPIKAVYGNEPGQTIEIYHPLAQLTAPTDSPRNGRDAISMQGGLIDRPGALSTIIVR